MSTDKIIKLIRFLRKFGVLDYARKASQSKLALGLILVAVLGTSVAAFALLSGGGGSPTEGEVQGAVGITENSSNGTVTFTLKNDTVDKILIMGATEQPIELSKIGQSYTAKRNSTITVVAVIGDKQQLVTKYTPSDEKDDGNKTTSVDAVIKTSTQSVPPKQSITFDANNSYIPNSSGNASYNWTFGDGDGAKGETVEHQYEKNGSYTVTLNITTESGESAQSTVNITVVRGTPIAKITAPANGTNDENITLSAVGSSDPNGDNLSYEWSYGDGKLGSGEIIEHKFSSVGTYYITVTVSDKTGLSSTDTAVIQIENRDPVASAIIPNYGPNNSAIAFDATESFDSDNQSLEYEWTFGDGTTAEGESVSHSFNASGMYAITLTVTDPVGASDVYKDTISITDTTSDTNTGPVANISEPENESLDMPVLFNANESYDVDGDSLSYWWDFGDGTTEAFTGPNVTHTYNETGNYTVQLSVSDGDITNTTKIQVQITNSPPTANVTANVTTTNASSLVALNASNSTEPDNHNLTYEWTLGDGTTATGEYVEHAYSTSGTYNVTLTTTDPYGLNDTDEITIRVNNTAPEAFAYANRTDVNTLDSITFNGSNSSDPEGQSLSYTWDFADGSTSTNKVVTHSYSESGTYNVTLTVSDGEFTTSDTVTINVSPTVLFADSFEQGSMSSWATLAGSWNVTSGAAIDGSYKTKSNGTGTQVIEAISLDGFPHDANITVSAFIESSTNGSAVVNFAGQNSSAHYRVVYAPNGTNESTFALQRISSSGKTTLDSVAPATGTTEWINISINRTPDGTTTVTAYTPATGTTETLSAKDSTYTSRGFFRLQAVNGDQTWYDNITITDD